MTNQNKVDAIEVISQFQRTIGDKPTLESMYNDVVMMKFKIKPLQGDIAILNFKNYDFISALWSLGKLDECIQQNFGKLESDEQEIFGKMIDYIRQEFQQKLNTANIKASAEEPNKSFFEMEIYKDSDKRLN